jgi:long-chain fatty acid transport protein
VLPPRAPGSRALVALAAVTATTLWQRSATASPQDLFGYGARSVSMGGTGVAIADDYSAVYANPANLTRARRAALTIGYQGGAFQLWTRRGDGPATHAPMDITRGVLLGLVIPIPLPRPLDDRFSFGIGLHLPTDVIGRNLILRPETPQFLLLENRSQGISLQGGLGIRLPFGFRIGGGAAALAALSANLVIANDSSGNISWRIDDRLVTSYAPVAGISWERGGFRVGATVRAALIGALRVRIEAHDLGINLPPFNLSGVAAYDPWQVALEGGWLNERWAFALGLTFKRWSEYPGPLEATTENSPQPPPPAFDDTLVVRAGVEHRWFRANTMIALRGGYAYDPTPVPRSTGAPYVLREQVGATTRETTFAFNPSNYLDNDRHILTFGTAISATARGTTLTLDAYGQLHVLAPRTNTKLPDVPSDNPGYPSLTSGGTALFLGVSASVSLR